MDTKIFRVINQLSGRNYLIDTMMIFVSTRFRYVYILILFILLFKKKSDQEAVKKAVTSALFSLLLHGLIKLFYFKPRPFIKKRVGILIPSKMNSTFPSKHTLLVFAISTSIFFHQRFLGLMMWVLSFLTGFSRIWVGHHYPSDIIGSAIIGSFTSVLIQKVMPHNRTANH